jgi:hypothetical protein
MPYFTPFLQKTVIFIVTAVKTSHVTGYYWLWFGSLKSYFYGSGTWILQDQNIRLFERLEVVAGMASGIELRTSRLSQIWQTPSSVTENQ